MQQREPQYESPGEITNESPSLLDETLEQTGVMTPATALEQLNKSEIDIQIATAKKYPRSESLFVKRMETRATISADIAKRSYYTVPRDGKQVSGPSIRIAEIAAQCWGNIRVYATILNSGEDADFVTVRGVCHDLESNTLVSSEVMRRITKKNGQKFSADMIQTTVNAARSIALRNAILSVVPRIYVDDVVAKARKVAGGDSKTLGERREATIAAFEKSRKIIRSRVFAALGVGGIEDIGLEQFADLQGMLNSIDEGRATADDLFPDPNAKAADPRPPADRLADKFTKPQTTAAPTNPPTEKKPGGSVFDDVVCDHCGKAIVGEPFVAVPGTKFCNNNERACAKAALP